MSDSIKLIQKNKKAYFNYEMIEELECGVALQGTEVKSIREGKCSFSDSYIVIKNGELILIGFLIQPYSHGNIFNHEPSRNRKLLAHRMEIKKFQRKVNEKGLTMSILRLKESVFVPANKVRQRKGLGIALWGQYFLDNFATFFH